jgi:hypothetical protein
MLLQTAMLRKKISLTNEKNRNTSERKVLNPIKGSLNDVDVVVVVGAVIEFYLWAIHY